MDRLLCGDVGYGKTEVATVLLLRRSWIKNSWFWSHDYLAEQHYNTFMSV